MTYRATMFLTVLHTGLVDLRIHEHKHNGKPERTGQRITIAPWKDVLAIITPQDNCRVIVSTGSH